MRAASDVAKGALAGAFNWRWVADVVADGSRVLQDVPISAPRFTESGTAQVQHTGECTIIYQDDFAQSIAPRDVDSVLAPFGTRLNVAVQVTVGPLVERIPFGVFLIDDVPRVQSTHTRMLGRPVTVGDRVELQLKDLFAGVSRDRFDTPGAAPDLSSVWGEFQRLLGFPVSRSVPDGPIPASVAYEEDKLKAVYDLARVLDARPYVNQFGQGSMRPNEWPAPVDELVSADVDPAGGLISCVYGLSTDGVYNTVVVRGKGADDSAIVLATAEITEGPLRARNTDGTLSPFRRVPYYYQSDYIRTADMAQQVAWQILPRVSRMKTVHVDLTERFNPLREVGDVLQVRRLGEQFVCRVTEVSRQDRGAQHVRAVIGGAD